MCSGFGAQTERSLKNIQKGIKGTVGNFYMLTRNVCNLATQIFWYRMIITFNGSPTDITVYSLIFQKDLHLLNRGRFAFDFLCRYLHFWLNKLDKTFFGIDLHAVLCTYTHKSEYKSATLRLVWIELNLHFALSLTE